MKIAILTLPLNDNFGGILQAYALRQYLVKAGHEVVHVEKDDKSSLVHWSSFRFYTWWSIRWLAAQILGSSSKKEIYRQIYNFRTHTSKVRTFVANNVPRKIVNNLSVIEKENFDILIVGSDQIWRPHYYPEIEDAFLSFADEWRIKKVAYAPSFGVQHWEFNEEQTKRCARLLSKFDAVSVREQQGVDMCKDNFKVNPIRLIDRTMLLRLADYQKLVGYGAKTKKSQLTTYILDMNSEKLEILDSLKKENNMECIELGLAEQLISGQDAFQSDISVEEWLREFMQAEFIFTDSFHGCVFAILFHKQFIVYGNKKRGLSRFKTLLQLFELEDRMVFDKVNAIDLYRDEINWEKVDVILSAEKAKSKVFFESIHLTVD